LAVLRVVLETESDYLIKVLNLRDMSEKSPIKPLGDRVIVRPLTEQELGTVSASGIIIPNSAKEEKPEQGIVIAVGPGKWDKNEEKRMPLEVKEGDKIVFTKYGYDELKLEKKTYFIVSESGILGIFE
jgi:chaperonin GroES